MKIKAMIALILLITIMAGIESDLNAQIRIERSYENYVTYLIDGFNVPDSWKAKFSRYRTHNWNTESTDHQESNAFLRWKVASGPRLRDILPPYPDQQREFMTRNNVDTTNYMLGIRGKFVINGYNWVVLEPRTPLFLRGIGKAISFWLWGGNYKYNITITVKDYRGDIHEIEGGSLFFIGWRYIRIRIPDYIPQRDVHMPANKYLQFLRIKFESEFNEVPDKFYVWIGSMWGEVDLFKDRFWGEALLDEENW